jgi:hypothetical protein
MVIKYTNIFLFKALQNLPKSGIFGSKTNHLATLLLAWRRSLSLCETGRASVVKMTLHMFYGPIDTRTKSTRF